MSIAIALKSEIARLARKELRPEVQTLKKAVSGLKSENVALKRRVNELEVLVRKLSKAATSARQQPADTETDQGSVRFSAKGLAAQRKRLGLSANELGLLIGASGQSIYNWEQGAVRPRRSQLEAIAAVRKLGKKAAAARLAALRAA